MKEPQRPTLEDRIAATRPPHRAPFLFQRWEHLLFLHWEVPPETIQETLPPGLHVDTHEGRAFLGVVPFFMRGLRPRFCPAVPGLSNFLELNLRTYVHDADGLPGVWFYSLDANQRLAVRIARSGFALPYRDARITAARTPEGSVDFRSTRQGDAEQRFEYHAAQELGAARPGTPEFFLVERYRFFSYRSRTGTLHVGQVHHDPYLLFGVNVPAWSGRMLPLNGFPDPGRPPDHALLSPGVDVTAYRLQTVRR